MSSKALNLFVEIKPLEHTLNIVLDFSRRQLSVFSVKEHGGIDKEAKPSRRRRSKDHKASLIVGKRKINHAELEAMIIIERGRQTMDNNKFSTK